MIAEDTKTGEVVLVMNEPEPWEDSDERLLALQERFNANDKAGRYGCDGAAPEHRELP